MSRLARVSLRVVACAWILSFGGAATGQDEADGTVAIVDFARDVRPIFEARCLSCHGPDEAKNDFRIDDSESVFGYVEAADLEGSSLWVDYLRTEDPDMLMPPSGVEGQPGGLPGAELAVIKLWIEEGADFSWPTDNSEMDAAHAVDEPSDASLAARIWAFQGLFHPASVHFPIALLMVSALFVFLSFFSRTNFEPVAFHCLWIGALGALGSCLMGWSYAAHEGYGAGFSFKLMTSAIDRHRWLGIGVAVLAILLVPVAHSAYKKGSFGKKMVWFLGAVLLAVGVSITGYQGGELTYGEDHYLNEFNRLFPEAGLNDAQGEAADDAEAGGEPQANGEATAVAKPAETDAQPALDPDASSEPESNVEQVEVIEATTAEEVSQDAVPLEAEAEIQSPANIEVESEDGHPPAEDSVTDVALTPVSPSPDELQALPPVVVNPGQPDPR